MSFIVKGVTSIFSGNAKKKASRRAQDAYNEAQNNAIATSHTTQDAQEARFSPYSAAGRTALSRISAGTQAGGEYVRPFAMSDFQTDPGYAFRKEEGLRALDRTLASRGSAFSGAQLRGTEDYAQNIASEEYNNAYNRYNTDVANDYNRTNNLAQLGFNADTAIADTLGTEGRDVRNSQIDIGGNNAGAVRERGAITADTINNVGTEIGNGINAIGSAFGAGGGGLSSLLGGGGGGAASGGLTSLLSGLGLGGGASAGSGSPSTALGGTTGMYESPDATASRTASILQALGIKNTGAGSSTSSYTPSSSGVSLRNLANIFSSQKGR